MGALFVVLVAAALGVGSIGAEAPLAQSVLPTTDGSIAIGNLNAQIDGELRLARRRPFTPTVEAGLAELYATRGHFLGRISDYERALEISDRLVRQAPKDGRSYLARARARALFHRFSEALADLERAERIGANAKGLRGAKAAILQALGRYDEALALRRQAALSRRNLSTLSARATLLAERGDVARAERLFVAAQHAYRDVSPFPVAWMYFQQGKMWMQQGDLTRARDLFQAAVDRLPAYAPARGHLAEVEAALGETDHALDLLRPLAGESDDPDYAAQLARILLETGASAEAQLWRDRAARRYDELMELYPDAFADHAAEFWLAAGNDPAKAFEYARRNAALRSTPRAAELLAVARARAEEGRR